MRKIPTISTLAITAAVGCSMPAFAVDTETAAHQQEEETQSSAIPDAIARFVPTADPIRHRIDYGIWDWALKNIVVSMGRSLRKTAKQPDPVMGTRIRQGHNSRYRLEGSVVGFVFLEENVKRSFTEYREDLQSVADTLDISSLPRNEQLAYWLNLHNVAMVEQIAKAWPLRQPRELMIDGVPLDQAKIVTVNGIALSPNDIRTKIVYPNWKDPRVIYGFWRGEIGGPALDRHAYNGKNVGSLLNIAADDFINSLRGSQKLGKTMQVSTLYDEVAPFYFPDFEVDLRAHIAEYADEDTQEILDKTTALESSIREYDIADLSGGKLQANYLFAQSGNSTSRIPQGMWMYLKARDDKLRYMNRKDIPTGTVIFSNIDLPGDPPNKNAVE